MVLDVLEAGLAPQIEPQLKSREDKYVVFISGVNAGCSLSNPLQFQLLVDHITGHLGDEKEQGIAAEIVHVVIAGNSVEIPLGLLNGQVIWQNLASKDQSRLSEPVQELDILLTQIAAGVPMDIMPGSNDPANFSLPQQSLNRWLFPGSIAYNTFRSCTDPHCFELDGVRILGTSGQNIDDLKKYSEGKDELEFMERTLKWRHVAPTTPNTLAPSSRIHSQQCFSGCYPFTDRDPFLIENCPHVYFVGNQDKYGTHILKGSEGQLVKLISIPKFCNTGMVAVVSFYMYYIIPGPETIKPELVLHKLLSCMFTCGFMSCICSFLDLEHTEDLLFLIYSSFVSKTNFFLQQQQSLDHKLVVDWLWGSSTPFNSITNQIPTSIKSLHSRIVKSLYLCLLNKVYRKDESNRDGFSGRIRNVKIVRVALLM
ncbi:DNA polymerase delta small subunit isoform X2 [Populus alba]